MIVELIKYLANWGRNKKDSFIKSFYTFNERGIFKLSTISSM